jgi:hypothetical protein
MLLRFWRGVPLRDVVERLVGGSTQDADGAASLFVSVGRFSN